MNRSTNCNSSDCSSSHKVFRNGIAIETRQFLIDIIKHIDRIIYRNMATCIKNRDICNTVISTKKFVSFLNFFIKRFKIIFTNNKLNMSSHIEPASRRDPIANDSFSGIRFNISDSTIYTNLSIFSHYTVSYIALSIYYKIRLCSRIFCANSSKNYRIAKK